MSNSNVFLITATLCMIVCLIVYNPIPTDFVDEEDGYSEVEGDFYLYSNDIFMYSEFVFVRARILHEYALYEVIGDGDAEKLKAELQEHLKQQGSKLEVMIMVLDKHNTEMVREIL